MQITLAAKTLLFEQQQFFRKESFSGHLTLPALLTLLYACIAAVCTSGGNIFSGVGTAVMILIAWIVVAAVFYLAIKVIGHTECTYTPILAATGYASVPLLIGTLITSIVTTTVGGFSLMTTAVLFWCIPIWVYAVSAVINLPAKAVLHILILPILLIFVVELGSIFVTGSPLGSGGSGGAPVAADPGVSMGSGGGMSFSMGTASGPGMGGGPGPR